MVIKDIYWLMTHGTPKYLGFLGSLGVAPPDSKQRPATAQLSREHCGRLQLTCSSSQLHRGCLVGPNQDPRDDLEVPECSGILDKSLPSSKQSPTATQIGRDCCGRLQLTCGSLLPGNHWAGRSQDPSDDPEVLQCSRMLNRGLPVPGRVLWLHI